MVDEIAGAFKAHTFHAEGRIDALPGRVTETDQYDRQGPQVCRHHRDLLACWLNYNLAFYSRRGYRGFLRETIVPSSLTVHMMKRLTAAELMRNRPSVLGDPDGCLRP